MGRHLPVGLKDPDIATETLALADEGLCLRRLVAMDPSDATEWQWFRRTVRDALLRPRGFAAEQAREHYGLAGIVVAIGAGFLFSAAVDSLVVAAKGVDPLDYASRIVTAAALGGIRFAILAALAALIIQLLSRLDRRRGGISLDRAFTAIAFGLLPLALAPIPALLLAVAPALLPLVGVLAALLAVRLAAGLALNLGRLLRPALALAACAVFVLLAALAHADQANRIRFVALGYAPELAPALIAAPPQGTPFVGDGFRLTIPPGWRNAQRGIPGEVGRFETDTASLIVLRISGSAFLTPDGYADLAATPWIRGTAIQRRTRVIERVRDQLLIDDVVVGTVDGRPVVLRQLTAVAGSAGLALQFRYIEPSDDLAALAEAASIATSWEISRR